MGLARDYAEVLRLPHAMRVFVPALVGKLSFTMVVLAILLSVQAATDSFTVAGIATGAFGLTNVVASPYRARFVDRSGQRRGLGVLAAGFALGMFGLAIATAVEHPAVGLIVALALVSGVFAPPIGAAMRVLWANLAPTPALKSRAYSLDAVADEVLYTTGPLIVTLVIAIASPTGGLIAVGATALIGTLLMTSGVASRAHAPVAEAAPASARPLRQRGFVPALVALLGTGLVIGVVEIGAPAIASDQPTIVVGLLIAMLSLGSGIGGLVYGNREWRSRSIVRLIVLGAAMALACGTLVLAPNLWVLGGLLVIVGLFLAPSLVTGYVLADELTVPEVRTEASSWINTSTNLGGAVSTAVGGFLIDTVSTDAALGAGAVAALACVAIATPFLLRKR
jgi:MFS family permease